MKTTLPDGEMLQASSTRLLQWLTPLRAQTHSGQQILAEMRGKALALQTLCSAYGQSEDDRSGIVAASRQIQVLAMVLAQEEGVSEAVADLQRKMQEVMLRHE